MHCPGSWNILTWILEHIDLDLGIYCFGLEYVGLYLGMHCICFCSLVPAVYTEGEGRKTTRTKKKGGRKNELLLVYALRGFRAEKWRERE